MEQIEPRYMTDKELLAMILPRPIVDKVYGNGLRDLFDQPTRFLTAKQSQKLCAVRELNVRYMMAGMKRGDSLTDPSSAARYFSARLRHLPHEVFAVLFLDTRHRCIAFEEMFRGTIDGAEVHPREIVRRALECNAAAVMVGHNHPNGHSEPSAADRAVTQRLKQALALVDIRVLDHFVIGDGPPISMAARGWI